MSRQLNLTFRDAEMVDRWKARAKVEGVSLTDLIVQAMEAPEPAQSTEPGKAAAPGRRLPPPSTRLPATRFEPAPPKKGSISAGEVTRKLPVFYG